MMTLQLVSCVLVAMSCALASQAFAGERREIPPPQSGPVVWMIDEVQELYPDTNSGQTVKRLTVHAARNTIAGVHVMIMGLRGFETIRFSETGGSGIQGFDKYSKDVTTYRTARRLLLDAVDTYTQE